MTTRAIQQIIAATDHEVAPGLYIKRPIPASGLDNLDPFLLLDHFGPTTVARDTENTVPDHPHKGFEPVTLLFQGKGRHKDSLGNDITLTGGDVGWMTAGKGIVHFEQMGPNPEDEQPMIHGIQLWVNLPIADKYAEPGYQHIQKAKMPHIQGDGWAMKLIAGEYGEHHSPTQVHSPLLLASIEAQPAALLQIPVPEDWHVGVYVMEGRVEMDGQDIASKQLAVTGTGDQLVIKSTEESHFLVLAGKPLHERIASYGPFVMTNMREVLDAIEEYQTGQMGAIIHD